MPRSRTASVLLATLLLVGGLNLAAYAANGHPLLLGRANHEASTTTLVNSGRGPALRLQTRAGVPPLSVSSGAKVPRLNADRLDGRHGRDLGVRAWTYSIGGEVGRTEVVKAFPDLPTGLYLVRYRVSGALAEPGGALICGFDVGPDDHVLSTGARGTLVTLDAWGPVDARGSLAFRCTGDTSFDLGTSSVITFIRVTSSSVREAVTTYP